MLVLLELDRATFSRPISSLPDRPGSFRICFDASLEGIGVVVKSPTGVVVAALKAPAPFNLHGDSGFQNSMEFLAVTMGLALAVRALGVRSISFDIIGDNRSSLAWASTQRFRSGPSRSTALLFVSVCAVYDLAIASSEHIPGELNIVCDGLSRNRSFSDFPSILPSAYYFPSSSGAFNTIYTLCNPLTPFDFTATWLGVGTVAAALPSLDL